MISGILKNSLFILMFLGMAYIAGSCNISEQSTHNDIQAMLAAKKSGDSKLLDEKMKAVIAHGETALPRLVELLDTTNPDQLSVVQVTLLRIGEQAESSLAKTFTTSSSNLKLNAISTLELLNAESVIPDVVKVLRDPDPQVRVKAAGYLYKFNRREGLDYLGTILKSGTDEERKSAINELVKNLHPDSRNVLMDALKDPVDFIKIQAISGLGRLKDPTAVSELDYVRENSRSWLVRQEAAISIYRITGNIVPYKSSEGREIFPDKNSLP